MGIYIKKSGAERKTVFFRCKQKNFADQMENDGCDNELLLEKIDEVFNSFLASSVDDIRDYLDM